MKSKRQLDNYINQTLREWEFLKNLSIENQKEFINAFKVTLTKKMIFNLMKTLTTYKDRQELRELLENIFSYPDFMKFLENKNLVYEEIVQMSLEDLKKEVETIQHQTM